MFLDEAIIDVRGGSGGRGCVGWRREKYVPMGGPDGGDGGRGGNIVLVADENTDTLTNFSSKKRFEAQTGKPGSGNNRGGKDGEDLLLLVPPGTTISDVTTDTPELLADLHHAQDTLVVAHGGRGGFGNAHFVSSTRQRPDFAELGEPGEHKMLKLELKLVADVGIIGYPSVGKSTLISVISKARPKIADYPFTTLVPNLGVVHVGERDYTVCDVPGLIEGASEGKGLGDAFLKHIERCGVLVHVLDLSRALREGNAVDIEQLVTDYQTIRNELSLYSLTLNAKRELIVLNKIDLLGGDASDVVAGLKKKGIDLFTSISAAAQMGTLELTQKLLPIVLEEREKRAVTQEEEENAEPETLPVLKPHLVSTRMGAYRIEQRDDAIVVSGKRLEQFAVMTDFSKSGGVERFRDVAERIGLIRALKRARKENNDMPVYIGKIQVDEYL